MRAVEMAPAILSMSDDELKIVEQAVSLRRKTLREVADFENRATIYVGDKVQIINAVRPKKLAGQHATVREIMPDGQFKVELDFPVDTGKSVWRIFITQPSHVTRLS